MKPGPLLRCFLSSVFLTHMVRAYCAVIAFQDGFESGGLGPAWLVHTSGDGRCTVTTNFAPTEGKCHLVLDDSVSHAMYSVASAAFKLDLTNRKNVVLHFKAKSLGNEFDYPYPSGTDEFDGVSLSGDGGQTWNEIEYFDRLGAEWQSFSIDLDRRLPWPVESWRDTFLIRFSQYDNAPAPLDGIAIDDILVTADEYQHGVLELPDRLTEGTGPCTGYILLAYAPTSTVTVALSCEPQGQLSLPASVEIPAGQSYAAFQFSAPDDNLANLSRTVQVLGTATNITIPAEVLRILDDDAPKGTLFLPPQVVEGGSPGLARLVLEKPVSVLAEFRLSSEPDSLVYADTYEPLQIPPGSKELVFGLRPPEDNRLVGNIPVMITLTSEQMDSISAATSYIDNEKAVLSLELPETMGEGMAAHARVRLGGYVSTNVMVTLTSSDETTLTVQHTVTTWGEWGEFQLMAPDNTLPDGLRHVQVTASAPGFAGTSAMVAVSDNEVRHYRVTVAQDLVDVAEPLSVSIQGVDCNGDTVSGGINGINLFVVLPGGAVQPVSPPSINISSNTWSGDVRLPQVNGAWLQLRAVDGNGVSGESTPFGTIRVVGLRVADLIWDPFRNRAYASVPASAPTNANSIAIIDCEKGVVAGLLPLSQDPGKLELTSAGEFLYVVLRANGAIARIAAESMNVESTFPVGTDPQNGTLYAADMCAIAGKPFSLVVSRENRTTYPRHAGVAVYDDGVSRPVTTPSGVGSNVIEPSADPDVFFGYSTEQSPAALRKLRVDALGITQIESSSGLLSNTVDIVAQGNMVFAETGAEVDAMEMRYVGAFPAEGAVRPDFENGRVYFLRHDPYSYWGPLSIAAFELSSFLPIRSISVPATGPYTGSFIRWGTNGLAFRKETAVVLIDAGQLVPTGPSADLSLTLLAAPNPVFVSNTLTYTVCVSNQGPGDVTWAHVSLNLSEGQWIQNARPTMGISWWTNGVLSFDVPALRAGTQAVVQVETIMDSAGLFTATATASSTSSEEFGDNSGTVLARGVYSSGFDSVNKVRVPAAQMLYDPGRQVLWATVSPTNDGDPSGSVVAIDPLTGFVSEPLQIGSLPTCLALSGNGRYLYVGLENKTEIHRIDLGSAQPVHVRIPIGGQTSDIEVLDGDGTSFIIARSPESAAVVFDGDVERGVATGVGQVGLLEQTGAPGTFLAYDTRSTLSALQVNKEGVRVLKSVGNLVSYQEYLVGGNGLALSSSGLLIDSFDLSLKARLGMTGIPCLDALNERAYFVYDRRLHGFDTVSFQPTGSVELPLSEYWYGVQSCVRWGSDGFALNSSEGLMYVVRWSAALPDSADSDKDGVSDRWELTNFGSLGVDLAADADGDGISNGAEYGFGTAPNSPTANPLRILAAQVGNQPVLDLRYPRRAGLSCTYELSQDLSAWAVLEDVQETLIAVETVDGVNREVIEATVALPKAERGFVRVTWAR